MKTLLNKTQILIKVYVNKIDNKREYLYIDIRG